MQIRPGRYSGLPDVGFTRLARLFNAGVFAVFRYTVMLHAFDITVQLAKQVLVVVVAHQVTELNLAVFIVVIAPGPGIEFPGQIVDTGLLSAISCCPPCLPDVPGT